MRPHDVFQDIDPRDRNDLDCLCSIVWTVDREPWRRHAVLDYGVTRSRCVKSSDLHRFSRSIDRLQVFFMFCHQFAAPQILTIYQSSRHPLPAIPTSRLFRTTSSEKSQAKPRKDPRSS